MTNLPQGEPLSVLVVRVYERTLSMLLLVSLPAMPQHPQVKLVMQGIVYQEFSEQRNVYH